MGRIRLADYCCQGGNMVIDQGRFAASDLIISKEGNRELIFSPLGNHSRSPRLALVGITPGAQSKKFERLLKFNDVETAAKESAFAGVHKTIRTLVTAHGFLDALGISCPLDVNESRSDIHDLIGKMLPSCEWKLQVRRSRHRGIEGGVVLPLKSISP